MTSSSFKKRKERCKECNGEITMMAYKGTGVCCLNCDKAMKNEPVVKNAGVK